MANNTFLDFNKKTSPTITDYLVGHDSAGADEYRTQIQNILPLTLTYAKDHFTSNSITFLNATAVYTVSATDIATPGGNSDTWNDVSTVVQSNSASWEESADILPTVTNYLSTEQVTVSTLNVTEQLLSADTDLFNLFLTPNNTLTTSVCAMSGDGVTPFVMGFTNGLLTSITV